MRDAIRLAATRFGSNRIRWPENVAKDIPTPRDGYFGCASGYNLMSEAAAFQGVQNVRIRDLPKFYKAIQRIRSRLNLSADSAASCVGHSR